MRPSPRAPVGPPTIIGPHSYSNEFSCGRPAPGRDVVNLHSERHLTCDPTSQVSLVELTREHSNKEAASASMVPAATNELDDDAWVEAK
eukprot:84525-Prymnesium_polylepis.1